MLQLKSFPLSQGSKTSLTVTANGFEGAADGRVTLMGDVARVRDEAEVLGETIDITYLSVCMFTYICMYIHVYIYIYICIYIYIYIYIYTRTPR